MKYSELISFHPIEDVIQLTTADNSDVATSYVKSYVMSDAMAANLKATVIDQLRLDEVIDNKGVLVVGNYGTGKSHLMSVISAVANNADNLQYIQNKNFADEMTDIAGQFEVLRIEIGGVTMPLREIIFGFIEDDFASRNIDFSVPNFNKVRDNKKLIKDMIAKFSEKYPDKGYLIVVDEFLSYLSSRDERQIVLDLEFFRALGEMCSKSKLRVIFGVQEKIFDNPRFSFVSETLKHVSDRFTQTIITKEATSYVVSERILKKTPEQKALIRSHLEKFSSLYTGMSSKMDEFVDLFPIHPSYIDVFNKIYIIENRHILKNISMTIRDIFDSQVPEDAPGIISFDNYWSAIKSNGLLKSDVTINRVVTASSQLEEIIDRSFQKVAYKPLAKKIIYALSVHRLTTNGLDVRFGLTAENLKDDLCLFLPMPEQDADFLLALIKTVLQDIMTTVSGQFLIFNDSNNQYYIDVNKVVDYDEKIKQKASIMANGELNRYFYKLIYECLDWEEKQYVPGFEIYQRNINWDSHNIFREGYLFLGLPGERSTAQPERDFYIHIMPPYSTSSVSVKNLPDEVYLFFKTTPEFDENMRLFAAVNALSEISDGKDKEAYFNKTVMIRSKLIKYLKENKNTCFDVSYKRKKCRMIEVLKSRYSQKLEFKDTVDLAASLCLDEYFNNVYPNFPVMKTKITRKNACENVRQALDYFAGRKSQTALLMLQSFDILDGDKIRPERSKYAAYYINLLKNLPSRGVINYSDIFEEKYNGEFEDKKFHISYVFMPIIFLSLVYAGYAVITLKTGKVISASELSQIPKIGQTDLHEFKYLSKPTGIAMAELKQLFNVLNINPVLLDNPKTQDTGVEQMLEATRKQAKTAVIASQKLRTDFRLWGEPLVNGQLEEMMRTACTAIVNEFGNYSAKYNTPAKLNNFTLTSEQIEKLNKQISLVHTIGEYDSFREKCRPIVDYIASVEYADLGDTFKEKLEGAKTFFRSARDSIAKGADGMIAAQKVIEELERLQVDYINIYFEAHRKKRLDVNEAKHKGKIQEGLSVANLRKLRNIDILSGAKFEEIEQDMKDLQVCYELTPTELKSKSFCIHCGYRLGERSKNVYGQLDSLENRINNLLTEWTNTLLKTISDPVMVKQMKYLTDSQRKAVDKFSESKSLPKQVDDFFVNTINTLLKGFEPVIIDTDDLVYKLEQLPPLNETAFRAKINEVIAAYTKGKNTDKLRIVVKRKESGTDKSE